MNAYACFPDLPSPVQRYIRTLEADKEALEADRAGLEARAAVAARRIAELSERVRYLEEQFRLAQLKRYAPRSEKSRERVFNEAEHEAKADPGTDERTVPLPDTGLPQHPPRSPEPPPPRRAPPPHPTPRGAGARCPQNCRASGLNTIFPTHRNAARTVSA